MGRTSKQLAEAPAQASPYLINLPQPPVRNAEEFLKAYIGYIYTAVGAIAQEVASIDLHLFKATFTKGNKPKTTEIFEHPALSILNYVNQLSTMYDIIEATQTYLELTGEAFWVVLKDTGGTPREIWLLRPDWIKVIPSETDVIDHYNYYAGGVITEKVEIPKANMIPFKYFNPMNPYRGKGATQAAALPFDILNFAQEYNRNFFFNSAVPSMVFSTEQKISEQSVKRFLEQWQNSFGGRTKSNKIAFLGNGMKMDKASFAAKELDFNEQIKQMRDDVLAVFKVPKTVLGLTEDVNRANADATTRAFMERVITPRMRKFVDTLNEFYLPMFIGDDNSIFFDFTDPAPEDVELKLKKYENARQNNWMTPNEVRAEENLEPLPGGDSLFSSPTGAPTGSNSQENPGSGGTPAEGPAVNEPPAEEPNKPGGEEAPKGLRASLVKMLGGKIEARSEYTPPEYLQNRAFKHMVALPTKKAEVIEKENLAAQFITPLKKFIAELLVQDSYAPLAKKKEKDNLIDDVKQALDKMPTEVSQALKERKKINDQVKNSSWTLEQKAAYWKRFIAHITEREAQVKEKAQMIFDEQEIMVLASLKEHMKSFRKRLGIKATASQVVPTIDDLNKLWKVMTDIFQEIYIEQGNYTMDFLGAGGNINITTEFASQYLVDYSGQLIAGIDDTTRTALMTSLSDGFDNGESISELSKRVTDIFDQADSVRAELIARTETLKASNTATVEAYRQSGVVVAKEWLTEMDNRTCPFCEEMDGKAIPLDDNYFSLGDSLTTVDGSHDVSMSFDYTDVGEPPLHGDCRCTTIPVIDTSIQGDSNASDEGA